VRREEAAGAGAGPGPGWVGRGPVPGHALTAAKPPCQLLAATHGRPHPLLDPPTLSNPPNEIHAGREAGQGRWGGQGGTGGEGRRWVEAAAPAARGGVRRAVRGMRKPRPSSRTRWQRQQAASGAAALTVQPWGTSRGAAGCRPTCSAAAPRPPAWPSGRRRLGARRRCAGAEGAVSGQGQWGGRRPAQEHAAAAARPPTTERPLARAPPPSPPPPPFAPAPPPPPRTLQHRRLGPVLGDVVPRRAVLAVLGGVAGLPVRPLAGAAAVAAEVVFLKGAGMEDLRPAPAAAAWEGARKAARVTAGPGSKGVVGTLEGQLRV
jgi:hypothetical protein